MDKCNLQFQGRPFFSVVSECIFDYLEFYDYNDLINDGMIMNLPPLHRYRYILWDWNGTLLNDSWLCVDIMNNLLTQYGKPAMTLERYQDIFDFPVRAYYSRLGFDFSKTPFEQVGSEFMEAYYARWRQCALQPHAREVLQTMQRKKMPQSILSAAAITLVQQGLEHFHLTPLFDQINGLNDHYAEGKLGVAQAFLAARNLAPKEVVLVGDTTHDFQVAQAVGMDCILFDGGHHALARLQSCGAPICSALAELLSWV